MAQSQRNSKALEYNDGSCKSPGRSSTVSEQKKRKYFASELERIEKDLLKEKAKIKTPERKEFTPSTFNNLAPYLDVDMPKQVILKSDDESSSRIFSSSVSRQTAIGLTDPWVDLGMDKDPPERSERRLHKSPVITPREFKERKSPRPPKEGSTHLPAFPRVQIHKGEQPDRLLSWDELVKLREKIKEEYTQEGQKKIEEDYVKTKQDFYRMELDKLDQVHPMNQSHLKKTYFAYLQDSPGSRRAVHECVRASEQEHGIAKEESCLS